MTEIETVQFACPTCAKRLMARVEQAGRLYACPGCGNPVPVPRIAIVPNESASVSSDATPAAEAGGFLTRVPATLPELLGIVLIAWSAFLFVALIVCFFGTTARYFSIILMLLSTLIVGQQVWKLLRARQVVLASRDVSLLWGMVRLIAWEPTEGVLILKNKSLHFSDDDLHDGKGGVRLVYPVLGEELVLRVPLETQTLHFTDQNVLTREYLSLTIRGTMKWRIADIKKFYLLVSRTLRATTEETPAASKRQPALVKDLQRPTTSQLVDSAVQWLRSIAEEQTRQVVSRVRSGLLIADKLVADVPEMRVNDMPALPPEFGGATEGLASAIHDTIAERLRDYGIVVAEVSLQEIRMPDEVIAQCIEAAKTAYLPLIAQRQASMKKEELKAEVGLLGKEAVGAREVVSNAPAYALRDFLTEFVAKNAPGVVPKSATIDLSQVAPITSIEAPEEPRRLGDETTEAK